MFFKTFCTYYYIDLVILYNTCPFKRSLNLQVGLKTRTKRSIRYAKENDREKRERRRERERKVGEIREIDREREIERERER